MSEGLIKLSAAVRMLAEARTLEEFTHIRNMAVAAEEYAKAEKLGDEAVQVAQEIRVRAARKAGDLLRQMKENGERVTRETAALKSNRAARVDLNDLGITSDQASRWQRMALVPDPDFEQAVEAGWGETAIARGGRVPRSSTREKTDGVRPKARRNGFTERESMNGLQTAAVQLEALAEALEGGLLGDWARLHDLEDAQVWFSTIEVSLPVVNARLKRAIREWKERAA